MFCLYACLDHVLTVTASFMSTASSVSTAPAWKLLLHRSLYLPRNAFLCGLNICCNVANYPSSNLATASIGTYFLESGSCSAWWLWLGVGPEMLKCLLRLLSSGGSPGTDPRAVTWFLAEGLRILSCGGHSGVLKWMAEEFSLLQENSILERERDRSHVPLDLESTLLHTLTIATESSAGHPGREEFERRVLKKEAMWPHFSISTP